MCRVQKTLCIVLMTTMDEFEHDWCPQLSKRSNDEVDHRKIKRRVPGKKPRFVATGAVSGKEDINLNLELTRMLAAMRSLAFPQKVTPEHMVALLARSAGKEFL